MTVTVKTKCQRDQKPQQKYGGYILPFDHINDLTVYSRIWKISPQDRYDYLCGRLAMQTEGLNQRMATSVAAAHLDDSGDVCKSNQQYMRHAEFYDNNNNNSPNNNNNNSPRYTVHSRTEWFLHPRVQDMVDHQMALMENTDSSSFPNLADDNRFSQLSTSNAFPDLKNEMQLRKTQKFEQNSRTLNSTYCNPFDPQLAFDGLIPMGAKHPFLGRPKKVSKENILVGMENISTLLEEHTSKYRLYNLALLQEPDIPMSPRTRNNGTTSQTCGRSHLPSLLQLSSFKSEQLQDKETTQLVKAFTDHKFEQIWHTDKYDENNLKPVRKSSLDLWELPRAELPCHIQLSPDSKILLWSDNKDDILTGAGKLTDVSSPVPPSHEPAGENYQGLNIQAPVFEPSEARVSTVSSAHSARRRLWEDTSGDEVAHDCLALGEESKSYHSTAHLKRSISDSDLQLSNRSSSRDAAAETADHFGVKSKNTMQSDRNQLGKHAQEKKQLQTSDQHVHKHAVVSIKDLEQQMQQQHHQFRPYPIDVMCSPYHLSQHVQRQYAMQQPQPHQQLYHQGPKLSQMQQPNFLDIPPPMSNHQMARELEQRNQVPIDFTLHPRAPLTYAQVATHQNIADTEAGKVDGQRMPNLLQQSVADLRLQQQLLNPSRFGPPPIFFQKQYQDNIQQQQPPMVPQQKGAPPADQNYQELHRQAMHAQQQQHQMEAMQRLSIRTNQNQQIHHPTVQQMFINARVQQQQLNGNHAGVSLNSGYRFPQPGMLPPNMQPSNQGIPQTVRNPPPNYQNNPNYAQQYMPWNSNNSNIYQHRPPHNINHQVIPEIRQGVPSLMSLDFGFQPEAAKVFQFPDPMSQNLAAAINSVQGPAIHVDRTGTSTTHQYIPPNEGRRPMDGQQLFRDVTAVSANTAHVNQMSR